MVPHAVKLQTRQRVLDHDTLLGDYTHCHVHSYHHATFCSSLLRCTFKLSQIMMMINTQIQWSPWAALYACRCGAIWRLFRCVLCSSKLRFDRPTGGSSLMPDYYRSSVPRKSNAEKSAGHVKIRTFCSPLCCLLFTKV